MQRGVVMGFLILGLGTAASAQEVVQAGKIPHIPRADGFGGEACVAMVLQGRGHTISVDQVFGAAGVDPSAGRPCRASELLDAARRLGFRLPPAFQLNPCVYPDSAPDLARSWRALVDDLVRGVPSVVSAIPPGGPRRLLLVTGYDRRRDELLYHDPAQARGANLRFPRRPFLAAWPTRVQGKRNVLRLPLELKQFKQPPVERGHTRAAFARHVQALRKRLPHPRFTIVVQAPFVVVGDEAPARVRSRSIRTVKWAADRLKAKYFKHDPTEILDVWLFRDAKSYTTNAKRLFGSKPTTTFGYYSSADKALVMNIATGGGTLVHEIVHPFMAANFPGVPSWFNEGLASLYEQCGERTVKGDKQIWGYTNWRLKNLQRLIRNKTLPRFTTLMKTTSSQFYDRDEGDNYAQARYLCYYLQDRGLLQRFFQRFQATRKQDPSGIAALQHVLGQTDLAAFQTTWEAWVLKLRFPS